MAGRAPAQRGAASDVGTRPRQHGRSSAGLARALCLVGHRLARHPRNVGGVTTVAIVAVVCIGLFVLGVISPHVSIKGERKLDFDLVKADRRVRRWPFPLSKLGDTSVRVSEWMVNRSSSAGRKTGRKARKKGG